MIAIDFGTTNSSIAILAKGDTAPRIQNISYGDPDSYNPSILRSAVSNCENYQCSAEPSLLGYKALRHYFSSDHDVSLLQEMKLHFDTTTKTPATFVDVAELSVLRDEGTGFLSREQRIIKRAIYEGDMPMTPSEFVPGTASFIRNLIQLANANEHRADAVFGVPASFQMAGKKRLREAAKRAISGNDGNYDGIHLYYEPLAAARAYMDVHDGNTLVLDYGGGTLDISVIAVEKGGTFDPKKIIYDGFSEGGSRMDQQLLQFLLEKGTRELSDWYAAQKPMVKRKISSNVEKAKLLLSSDTIANVEFPGSPVDSLELNRSEMTMALQGITNRMTAKTAEVVMTAVGKIARIDFVVMSGGSSLNPVVQNAVTSIFRHIPPERFVIPNPDNPQDVETCICAVVKGLALLKMDDFPPIDFGD